MWNDPEARRDALLEFAGSKEFDMVAVARQFKQMKVSVYANTRTNLSRALGRLPSSTKATL